MVHGGGRELLWAARLPECQESKVKSTFRKTIPNYCWGLGWPDDTSKSHPFEVEHFLFL